MPITRPRIARVVERAGAQHGVVTSAQLRALGVDRNWVARGRRAGILSLAVPRVYAVGRDARTLPRSAWEMTAVLAHASAAAIGQETAATRLGIWDRAPDDVHVLTTGTSAARRPPAAGSIALVSHRVRELPPTDVVAIDRVPTTTVARTCLDLGTAVQPLQLTFILREAVFRGLLDLDVVPARLDERAGWPGSRVVREAIALYRSGSAGTRSRTEDELYRLMIAAGFLVPIVNTRGATGVRDIETDFTWIQHRLVVEVDGSTHQLPGAPESDAARDDVLAGAGWHVLRCSAFDVWRRPRHVIARIARAMGR